MKVLEALALGIPVVTTPFGAEGILGRGGVAVETTGDGLAAAALSLMDDPMALRAAGNAAYHTFIAHHSPRAATTTVVGLYERMLGRKPQRLDAPSTQSPLTVAD